MRTVASPRRAAAIARHSHETRGPSIAVVTRADAMRGPSDETTKHSTVLGTSALQLAAPVVVFVNADFQLPPRFLDFATHECDKRPLLRPFGDAFFGFATVELGIGPPHAAMSGTAKDIQGLPEQFAGWLESFAASALVFTPAFSAF